ncbi:hypothetical protein JJJ17_08020 [Paracoccus caeni]|uniref:Uncharacterized protein n=1 Tax=Paracoccus caeni TaxID=657651 RepID=A0A934W012_9RHOB|nr:hypothetical protein [Paracoccus caeni]MBK4215868.1 hypothetical protein [Paracoccus caeni]
MRRFSRLILWIMLGAIIGAALSVVFFAWMLSALVDRVTGGQEAVAEAEVVQPLPMVDFSAGPVDLILEEGLRRWLVQDQSLVRKAATMVMADGQTKPPRSIFGALFSTKQRGEKDDFAISLVRNGETLSQQNCWTVDCVDLPEMQSFLTDMLSAGQQLSEEYESFPDHAGYLRAYAQASASPQRYGEIDPPQPEPERRLPERLYITFPITFFHDDGPATDVPDYATAFREEYAADGDHFELALETTAEDEPFAALMLRRCHDQQVVMRRDGTGPVFPTGWHFVSVDGWIDATPNFADKLEARRDWDLLPSPDNDPERLNRAILAAVAEQGDNPDPRQCYTVDGTTSGNMLTLWRDMPRHYGFRWVRIDEKEAP